MFLGPNMLILRRLHGKTLEEVAERLKTPRASVHRYENGATPPADYVKAFCRAFFVDEAALTRGPLAVPVQLATQEDAK